MSLTVAINTVSGADDADERECSHTGIPYGERADVLEGVIVPYLLSHDEVARLIIVGNYHDDPRWTYIEQPSRHFHQGDAVHQRQRAAEAETERSILFLHDDHIPDEGVISEVCETLDPNAPQLLSFHRRIWRNAGPFTGPDDHPIGNRGRPTWIMGHGCVMTQPALDVAPWSDVAEIETWDQPHTQLILERDVAWIKRPDLLLFDLELGEIPPWT